MASGAAKGTQETINPNAMSDSEVFILLWFCFAFALPFFLDVLFCPKKEERESNTDEHTRNNTNASPHME